MFKQKLGFSIQLRKEPNVAVNWLLDGKDVLQVLPTSFGNNQYFDISDLGWKRLVVWSVRVCCSVGASKKSNCSCSILHIEHLGGRNLRSTWTWNCNCFSQRFVSEEELIVPRKYTGCEAVSQHAESHVIEMWTAVSCQWSNTCLCSSYS